MHIVTRITRVGGSIYMIVPAAVVKEMKLLPGDSVVITYAEKQMDITKLNDILKDKDKLTGG